MQLEIEGERLVKAVWGWTGSSVWPEVSHGWVRLPPEGLLPLSRRRHPPGLLLHP